MIRRNALGGLAALVALVVLLASLPARAEEKGKDVDHHAHFKQCARACYDCSLECATCYRHCSHLVSAGKKEHARTMHLCNDCATICAAAGEVSGRAGPLAVTLCKSCAEACDTCGAACEKFPDDRHMMACAKACKDCAKACRDMIKHAAH